MAEVVLDYDGEAAAGGGKRKKTPAEKTPPKGPLGNGRTALGLDFFLVSSWRGLAIRTEPGRKKAHGYPPKTPQERYHFREDSGDEGIALPHKEKGFQPDWPFFFFGGGGGFKAPHQFLRDWRANYRVFGCGRGRFRGGFFERAKEKG